MTNNKIYSISLMMGLLLTAAESAGMKQSLYPVVDYSEQYLKTVGELDEPNVKCGECKMEMLKKLHPHHSCDFIKLQNSNPFSGF